MPSCWLRHRRFSGTGFSSDNKPDEAQSCFRQAAARFETMHRQGVHSASLYLDQGNAYMLAGKPAEAVLAYRRGSVWLLPIGAWRPI